MLLNKKKTEEGINLVIQNLEIDLDFLEKRLNYIKEKKGNTLWCIRGVGSLHIFRASHNLLFGKDIEKFKQDMYVFGKLRILGSESRGLMSNIITLSEMMLSNSKEILDFFIRHIDLITYEEKNKYVKSGVIRFLLRTVLLALKGEWEDVIRRADIYFSNPPKRPFFKYIHLEFEYLKAVTLKDIPRMKEIINEMLDKKVARKML